MEVVHWRSHVNHQKKDLSNTSKMDVLLMQCTSLCVLHGCCVSWNEMNTHQHAVCFLTEELAEKKSLSLLKQEHGNIFQITNLTLHFEIILNQAKKIRRYKICFSNGIHSNSYRFLIFWKGFCNVMFRASMFGCYSAFLF